MHTNRRLDRREFLKTTGALVIGFSMFGAANAQTLRAPKSVANCCRSSCRDMATIRAAPSSRAASTPQSPTAPSPTTIAVAPGRTPAATAACQPVAMTSDRASSAGRSDSSGYPSVLTREPSAWVTRVNSACPLVVNPRLAHADWAPTRQCGQVLSQWSKGTMTKSPGRKDLISAPTSSTTPTAS